MIKQLNILLLVAAACLTGCRSVPVAEHKQYSQFIGLTDFAAFAHTENENGETVLLSPEIKTRTAWNQLVLSWNLNAPPGTFLKVEASAILADHATKFYSMGIWSPDDMAFPRASALTGIGRDLAQDQQRCRVKEHMGVRQIAQVPCGGDGQFAKAAAPCCDEGQFTG